MKSTITVDCSFCCGSTLAPDGVHSCGHCMGMGHVEENAPPAPAEFVSTVEFEGEDGG